MKAIKIIAFLLILSSVTSCVYIDRDGSATPKNEISKKIEEKDFDRLDIGNAFIINVKQANSFRIEAIGDERDINDLQIVNRNGLLSIDYRNVRFIRSRMEINIEMPNLKDVDFSGASVSTIEGFDGQKNLRIYLSGASKLTTKSNYESFNVDLSGASILNLSSISKTIDIEESGASELNAYDAQFEDAVIDISGASRAKVNILKTLKVKASGASKVTYKGSPKVETNISGASTVEKY